MPDSVEVSNHVEVTAGDPAAGTPTADPAHREAMLKKADEGLDTTPKEDRLLAGKYKTRDQLQKGIFNALKKVYGDDEEAVYKALETEIGKRSAQPKADQGAGDPKPTETPKPATETPQDPNPSSDPPKETPDPSTKGPDYLKYTNEYVEKGKLSDESYKELEKQGFSKEMVDTYVMGMEAQVNSIYSKAGGKDQYFQMVAWAKTGMQASEIEAYNKAINSGNRDSMLLAVDGLVAKYTKVAGKSPVRRLTPENTETSGAEGYMSQEEWKRDMKDPRYSADPAFRQSVSNRLRIAMRHNRF